MFRLCRGSQQIGCRLYPDVKLDIYRTGAWTAEIVHTTGVGRLVSFLAWRVDSCFTHLHTIAQIWCNRAATLHTYSLTGLRHLGTAVARDRIITGPDGN